MLSSASAGLGAADTTEVDEGVEVGAEVEVLAQDVDVVAELAQTRRQLLELQQVGGHCLLPGAVCVRVCVCTRV
jgi:hypothetical protein